MDRRHRRGHAGPEQQRVGGLNADTQGGTRGPGIGAVAFVPAAVTVVVTVVLLWTTGNLSALVTHGQRPQARIEDMGAVAVRLVQHPGEPAAT